LQRLCDALEVKMVAKKPVQKKSASSALDMKIGSLNSALADAIKTKNFSLAKSFLKSNPPKFEWQRHHALGMIALAELQLDNAIVHFKTAALFDDCEYEVYANLTKLLSSKSLHKEAIPYAKKAHKLKPEDIVIGRMLVNSLLDSQIGPEIVTICDYYLNLDPDDIEFKLAKASTIRFLGNFGQAFLLVDEVLKVNPDHLVAMRLQADIVAEQDSNAGIKLYDRLCEKSMQLKGSVATNLKWNMCLHLLRTRDFKRGWEFWELGTTKEVGSMGRTMPKYLQGVTRADLLKTIDPNKWTLVCVEQGIGDQILFLSAMQEFIDEFQKVVFVCEERMQPIIRRAFPKLQLASPGLIEAWRDTQLPSNGFVPLGSLLARYRPTAQSFTDNRRAFLQVDGDMYHHYKKVLAEIAKGRPVVGISWKGGFWESQKRNKALEISQWLPIFERGAVCVNLQYGNTKEEEDYIESLGYTLVSFPKLDFKRHLDDWMAIAAACDGIISVSTAVVHFAGACGQKVAVVMPEPQGPWILGTDDDWSMVYPEVSIFRRNRTESVRDLVDRISGVIVS
jgi:tetratricopeptide (TPR) repeat protein